MNDEEAVVGGEVNIEVVLILAEVWRPDVAVVPTQCGGNGLPVNEVERVPDEQTWGIVKAGVSEVELVANPDGTSVGMISARGVRSRSSKLGRSPRLSRHASTWCGPSSHTSPTGVVKRPPSC